MLELNQQLLDSKDSEISATIMFDQRNLIEKQETQTAVFKEALLEVDVQLTQLANTNPTLGQDLFMSVEYQRQQALIGRYNKMSPDDELAQHVVFDPRIDPRTDTNNFDFSKPTPANPDNWQINPSSSTFTFAKPTSKPIPNEVASAWMT